VKCPHCERSKFRSNQAINAHIAASHPENVPDRAGKMPVPNRRPTLAEIDPVCIECGSGSNLVTGREVYPHRPDLFTKRFWLCPCGAYCGCHPGSVVPLGNPAGAETRKARMAAHDDFDRLWRSGEMTRTAAYDWLAGETGIARDMCHIGMMTRAEAELVSEVSSSLCF
jgi:hypothetical protein